MTEPCARCGMSWGEVHNCYPQPTTEPPTAEELTATRKAGVAWCSEELFERIFATLDARDRQLLATEVPAGCSHRAEKRYRCYECDRTFCRPCIQKHCDTDRKRMKALEWLVGEKDERIKAARDNVYVPMGRYIEDDPNWRRLDDAFARTVEDYPG